jgi:hypothetical protein
VAKVDVFLAVAELSRHPFDAFVVVPEFQMVLVDVDLQLQTDVLAADRVSVAFDANDTVGLHRHRNTSAGRAPLGRHGGERRDFLAKPFLSRRIAARGELPHECHVVLHLGEVTASPQPQGLVECILEVAMRRLHVAVLMRLANVDAMAFEAVMSEQLAVPRGEFFIVGEVVHRGRQAVTANAARHTACTMQGVLQAAREGLEGLRLTEVNVLPVRVSEDGVEQHVIESLPAEGDLQRVHDHEIKRDHVARVVHLRELDVLLDTVLQLPTLHQPFERATNRVRHLRRTFGRIVFLLEPIKKRIGLEPRIFLKQGFDFTPELRERIRTCTVGTFRAFDPTRQLVRITVLPDCLATHLQPP